MSEEITEYPVRVKNEDDLKTTPERPTRRSSLDEINDENSCSDYSKVKVEPEDCDMNMKSYDTFVPASTVQSESTEPAEKLQEDLQDKESLQESTDTREETLPGTNTCPPDLEDITDRSSISTVNVNSDNITTNNNVQNVVIAETEQQIENSSTSAKLNEPVATSIISSHKSAADLLNDGIATPIAPIRTRLRVKSEFSITRQSPEHFPLAKDDMLMDCNESVENPNKPIDLEHILLPPQLSSTSNSANLADGIATSRLTINGFPRLRVKTEFSHINEDSSSVPRDFFEGGLGEENSKESGEVSPTNSDEPIPDNFFDDLLRDQLMERIEEAKNNELEEKYSDRLKELERLENEFKRIEEKSKERRKNHKKQKKSKKKTHKRTKSRSPSPNSLLGKRNRETSPISQYFQNKRNRASPSSQELSFTSNYGNLNKVKDNAQSKYHIFDIPNENDLSGDCNQNNKMLADTVKAEPSVDNSDDIEEVFTPRQKREKALRRVSALLSELNDALSENNTFFSIFQFVSTVRKLPTSNTYVEQHIYENRSPLHTVNNVSYKFNSHATRFNFEEWGLAALPTHAAKIAKLVGCDAQFIHNKLKVIKIPAKLQKIKQECTEEEEDVDEATSSLHCNAVTQTDDIDEYKIKRKTHGYEIGVQVEPEVYTVGCQTLETESPTKDSHNDDEAPIMKIIRDLNENQLVAIHEFAELIKEPANNAMDMYKLRMQILEIYKLSQMPSVLATPQSQGVNNYTTNMMHNSRGRPPHQPRQTMQQPKVPNVGGGGSCFQFSLNEPRAQSATYSRNYDPRYPAFSQPPPQQSPLANIVHTYPDPNHQPSLSFPNQRQHSGNNNPTTLPKFYGRGACRR